MMEIAEQQFYKLLSSNVHGKVYRGVKEIKGSLMIVEGVSEAGYDEIVRVIGLDGMERFGRVLETSSNLAVIQILGSEEGLQTDVLVHLTGTVFKIPLSDEVIGRIFNGRFEPIDNLPPILSGEKREISGSPLNPVIREYPTQFIQTGISAIDGMLSLVRG